MRRTMVAACVSAAALMSPLAPAAVAKPDKAGKASERLQRAVTLAGVREHQAALQDIADANGGNRFAGRPGHEASAKYVYDTVRKAGWKARYEDFDYTGYFEDGPTVLERTAPNPATFEADALEFSGAGDVTAPLSTPSGDAKGCEAADFTGFTAGDVALVQRGACTFRLKTDNATAAGASAIIVVNNVPGPLAGTLGSEGGASKIPAVGVTTETGGQLAAGDTVHVKVESHTEQLTTKNVIAETPGGDPSNVVMAGAHLDSVQGGPGINDNGSGSAALLEIAQNLRKAGHLRNKVRLAWWSAEESGLVGSTAYVARHKAAGDLSDTALYLNFDMIGSPNFARFVYDGDNSTGEGADGPAGSAAIEQQFVDYFDGRGLANEPTPFDGRSDYGPFIDEGVPAGGLFTGAEKVKTPEQAARYGGTAGEPFDPCYHQACDTFDNNSDEALDQMSDAVADSVARYAISTAAVNGQADEQHGHHGHHGRGKHRAAHEARR